MKKIEWIGISCNDAPRLKFIQSELPSGGIASKEKPVLNLETLKKETGELIIPSKAKDFTKDFEGM